MRKLLLIITLLLAYTAQAQQADVPKPERKHIVQLGIYASPDMTGRFVKPEATPDLTKQQVIDIYQKPFLKLSYSAGLLVNIKAVKWLDIETGITYQNTGHQNGTKLPRYSRMIWNPATAQFEPDTTSPLSEIKKIISRYDFHHMGVPVNLVFKAGKGRVKFSGGVGVLAQVLVAHSESFIKVTDEGRDADVRFNPYSGLNRFNISCRAFAGVDIDINKLLMLRIQPYGMVSALPVSSKTPLKFYYFRAGLGTTLYFGL